MTDILCIGSVLWDVIGRCPDPMKHGFDRAGHIRRHPGGVAYNIAKALSNLNTMIRRKMKSFGFKMFLDGNVVITILVLKMKKIYIVGTQLMLAVSALPLLTNL